ncbi:signal peptidase I [Cohnella endophytica]|uniref:Signal peptidase I n=1 Tax=Cohnella endophytica TaxID=2419778 RepID=A0A494XBQ5_9BACL|nr:signal peptidase I [Cohnella endophytica]RKP48000.1 signal peptidase I [Cohnella endophytica]
MFLLKIAKEWIGTIAISFVLAMIVGIFLIQPYKVDGHSMDPTLRDGQRVFVSKLPHTFSYYPNYGDIVIIDSRVHRHRSFMDDVMDNPLFQLMGNNDDRTFYVKRVIGKPGDVLELKDHEVYRNGEPLDEPYVKEAMEQSDGERWVVPDGHIFVMGDNRNNSEDSRAIGFIPLDHVMGKKVL